MKIFLVFLALLLPVITTQAQETLVIKGIQNGFVPEAIILQSESQTVPKKHPPQITTQKFSEKNLSRLAKSLIFIEGGGSKCAINEMDIRTGTRKVIYQPKRCFLKLIVRSRTKFIFVYGDAIQEISLSPVLKEGPIIKHPKSIKRKDTSLSE